MAVMTKEDVYGGSLTAFPAGLRVLVVDNDFNCLSYLTSLLQACHYRATGAGFNALSLLRKNESEFDIVISDTYMSDMDGFRLLEIIQLEMDVPVVMMSKDNSGETVMKAINMGACGYLVKPVRKEEISVIWQHVVRKYNSKAAFILSSEDYLNNRNKNMSSIGEDNNSGGSSSIHLRKEEEEGSKNDIVSLKKQRMVWTNELHDQFVTAVNAIGLKNAVPKKILEFMKVPDLTRENVASHLQKYRIYLRRRTENVRKKPCNIPSAQAQNIMHPCMMGSSTMVAYPPPMSNQLHSQTSVVSRADIDEAERLSAGGDIINGVPISYYAQPPGYGLQPPPTAAIQKTEPVFLESVQSLNDDNGTINFSLPISFDVGQSSNQQQQQGGYNLFSYNNCLPDPTDQYASYAIDQYASYATDQYASYATDGNNFQSEYPFPCYDSFNLFQHYNNDKP